MTKVADLASPQFGIRTSTNTDGRKRKKKPPLLLTVFLTVVFVTVMVAFSLPFMLEQDHDAHHGPNHNAAFQVFQGGQRAVEGPVHRHVEEPAQHSLQEPVNQHIVFSTSCSPLMNWQSYTFFYFAWKLKQPGTVTRIATGCSREKEEELRRKHKEEVEPLSDKFYLYFTEDFAELNKGNYQSTKYFNKPFGVRHWLEKELGFPNADKAAQDAIIMILDPDMLLTKPLTNKFSSADLAKPPPGEPKELHVTHGSPFAQMYGFGGDWLRQVNKNLTHVVGDHSPIADLTEKDATDFYSLGPPYAATGKDMYKLVAKWTELTPRIFDFYGGMMSEMYGFCAAAAHLNMPHTVFKRLMISDIGSYDNEGAAFLRSVGRDEVCRPLPHDNMPPVFHYCQRYALGRWFFGKYKLPEDFFSCTAPLLRVPPEDLAVRYNYYIYPNTERVDYNEETQASHIKLNGFGACFLIDSLNEVGEYFRRNHCPNGANFSKSYIFHAGIDESLLYSIEPKK